MMILHLVYQVSLLPSAPQHGAFLHGSLVVGTYVLKCESPRREHVLAALGNQYGKPLSAKVKSGYATASDLLAYNAVRQVRSLLEGAAKELKQGPVQKLETLENEYLTLCHTVIVDIM